MVRNYSMKIGVVARKAGRDILSFRWIGYPVSYRCPAIFESSDLEGTLLMNRKFIFRVMSLLMLLPPGVSRTEEPGPGQNDARSQLVERATVIKPTAKELAWLNIPWVLDLKAAQTTAKAEGRPIFLWVTGDDPLERC
jgi:hypothetical protein